MAIVKRYDDGSRCSSEASKVVIALDKAETRDLLTAFIKTLTRQELDCILGETLIIRNENEDIEKVSVSVSFTHEIKMSNFKETIVLQTGEAYTSE